MAVMRQFRFFFGIPPIFAIVSTFVAVRNYDLKELFLVTLSFVLVWGFMSSVNNTYDVETDTDSQMMRTQNPLVTGELSYREVNIMNLALPVLSIAIGSLAGPYWIGLPVIGVILTAIYDLKPVRAKDTPFGFLLIAPLSNCLPFVFAYAAASTSFALPLWALCVFIFLFFNGLLMTHYLPDRELDLKLGILNFSTVYGAEAARKVDVVSTVLEAASLLIGVFLGGLSIIGIPLLLISVALRLRTLAQGTEALKNPTIFRKFAIGMISNAASMALCMVGSAI
jgi:4-hydroxybenzoate polyprenyltransferase